MKSLQEYIQESLSKEDIKDMHSCVKTLLDKIEFDDYGSTLEFNNELKKFLNGDSESALYDNVKDRMIQDYDFNDDELNEYLKNVLTEEVEKLL